MESILESTNQPFFNENPEALTEMAEIIKNNPDTWPMLIGFKYGIIPDDHFWENNPLQSLGSGTAAPVIYGRVRGKPYTGKSGKGIDIHKAILKVAPKKGFVLPGHKYTRPGNPLDSQLKYNPQTGEILEIYEQLTGRSNRCCKYTT